MSKPFTVVLLRPEYLGEHTEEEYGQDIYVAHEITAQHSYQALDLARLEVFNADKNDGLKPKSPEDYKLCVMFEGHHTPKLFGWQVY